MSLFNFPTVRVSYPTVGNPVYISDVRAANELMIDGLTALTDLPNPGFGIISGMQYTGGQYQPGVIWLNGAFYFSNGVMTEGLYMTSSIQPTLSKPFSDTNNRNIYAQYLAVSTANSGAGSTPLFTGNMNAYRIGLSDLKQELAGIQAELLTLGNAAFANIGTAAGSVASGTDPRLVGPLSFFDARYVQPGQVIVKGSGTAYVPIDPTDPVNKAYADQFSKTLAKGKQFIGDVPGGIGEYVIAFGHDVGTSDYLPFVQLIGISGNQDNNLFHAPLIYNQLNTQMSLHLHQAAAGVKNISVVWKIELP